MHWKLLIVILAFFCSFSSAISEDWIRIINPDSVRVEVSQSRRVVEIETWKIRGNMNFVNLSFWGRNGPVGRLVVDSVEHGNGKKRWPVMSLKPRLGEFIEGEMKLGFSGSNVLVRRGKAVRQGRTFFSRRRCPRTGIGTTRDGMVLVAVTTSATLKEFAKKLQDLGADFAINVDGGSSTMFIENGVPIWKSKRSAVPVILSW